MIHAIARQTFWDLSPDAFRDLLIEVGRIMSHAPEIVVANHLAQDLPVVLEGDTLLPALAAQDRVAGEEVRGRVSSVFLFESDEEVIRTNLSARSTLFAALDSEVQQRHAQGKWLYGLWLRDEAQRLGLPIVPVRPYETLLSRVLERLGLPSRC